MATICVLAAANDEIFSNEYRPLEELRDIVLSMSCSLTKPFESKRYVERPS